MSKTPRLVNPTPHTPYVYPKLVLPVMNNLTKNTRDPSLPARIQQPAPQPQLNRTPAPAAPLGPMTNTPNQVR